jgi:phosphoglycerate dehydrogenase-like enzyme
MPHVVMIASPLEAEHVGRIRAVPGVEVLYAPDLLAQTRYTADHKGHPFTRTPEQTARWQTMLRQADVLWDLPSPADLPLLERLKWIQTTSTGVGPAVADLKLAARGILVTTARGVHARPLAEFTFMALLAHFRGLRHLEAEQRAHSWVRMCGEEIAGRTLVILGAGDLARGCARIARALDMRVIALARDPGRSRDHNALFDEIRPVSALHATLAEADALVLTVPHTPETDTLIDAAAIAALKPGAALVNIARGHIIDEDAMTAALRSGHIAFAALDVARVEPLPADSPLWDLPNVLISPHSASTAPSENAKIVDIFCRNLDAYLAGRPNDMINILDKQRRY